MTNLAIQGPVQRACKGYRCETFNKAESGSNSIINPVQA